MKTMRLLLNVSAMLAIVLMVASGSQIALAQGVQPADPQGGGGPGQMAPFFTYQGVLKNGNVPVNGTCDFVFFLFDRSTAGNQIASGDYILQVPVNNGLFTATLNTTGAFGDTATQGAMRWLEIWVKCPSGVGNYVLLSPRQWVTAVPYAAGLVPGTKILGDSYQLLKITNNTIQTGIPAGVTGEINMSLDGVGVYGSNTVNTAGSTGLGVWGRTYSLNGAGVKGTGYNGSAGVYAVSDVGAGIHATTGGNGVNAPAVFAEATSTHSPEPGGIAVYALNHGVDASLVVRNTSTGDVIRAIKADGTAVTFRVDNLGGVHSPSYSAPGADLAEQFAVTGEAPEPGTLMSIDPEHPGQLTLSRTAYDPLVAGVVSGAGNLYAGVTLAEQDGVPIALAGRVYVKSEAISSPIHPGDLLTSSAMAGYAMKAADPSLAQGTVIGKAMTGLDSGTGLVLVIISLQ